MVTGVPGSTRATSQRISSMATRTQPCETAVPSTAAEQEAAPAGGPGPVGVFQPAESARQRRSRHGHRARLYVWAGLSVAALAVVIALIAANTQSVKLDWVVGSSRASLVWIILVATVLGWLLGITMSILFRNRTRRPAQR